MLDKARPTRIIVCLSTIPPRFASLGPTLESLLQQTYPAHDVVVSIPRRYNRFPDWDGVLPHVPRGITVLRSEVDYGPATKLLPALAHYQGQDVSLLICDDDHIAPETWLAEFAAAAADHPDCCITGLGSAIPKWLGRPKYSRFPRMKRWGRRRPGIVRESGFVDLLLGYRGALVRPEFFGPGVFQIPPVLWAHDDIWFSGQLELAGIPIWSDARISPATTRAEVHDTAPLVLAVVEGMDRADLNAAGVEYFRRLGIWRAPLSHRLRSVARRVKRFTDTFRPTRPPSHHGQG